MTKEQHDAIEAVLVLLDRDANDGALDVHDRAESENALREVVKMLEELGTV
jgi:hypothetical protein